MWTWRYKNMLVFATDDPAELMDRIAGVYEAPEEWDKWLSEVFPDVKSVFKELDGYDGFGSQFVRKLETEFADYLLVMYPPVEGSDYIFENAEYTWETMGDKSETSETDKYKTIENETKTESE